MALWTIGLIIAVTASCGNSLFLARQAKTQISRDLFEPAPSAVSHTLANQSSSPPSTAVANSTLAVPPVLQNKLPLLHAGNQTHSPWGTGVVHFLFLVNDNLQHEELWRQFLAGAPRGSWKVLIHCKDSQGCVNNGLFARNPGFLQVATTPTWYCHDLVTAMSHLLKRAMELNAAQYGEREKFVFLSESTLPIKPFPEVHGQLLLDDESDFCLFPSAQWGSSQIDGTYVRLLKHHQWVVLNRYHAEMFSRQWVSVNERSEWKVWLKTGSFQGRDRYVYPQSFQYPAAANSCTDEWAFIATIFGALEPMGGARQLDGFGGGYIDMTAQTAQGRCRTWSYWDNTWDPAATALASQIANDFHGSSLSCFPKCFARPATIEKISTASLQALRRSPFLFARKFSPNVWMPSYGSIVLDSYGESVGLSKLLH